MIKNLMFLLLVGSDWKNSGWKKMKRFFFERFFNFLYKFYENSGYNVRGKRF